MACLRTVTWGTGWSVWDGVTGVWIAVASGLTTGAGAPFAAALRQAARADLVFGWVQFAWKVLMVSSSSSLLTCIAYQAKPHECKDRKSVVSGKSVTVGVALGGRRIIKKASERSKECSGGISYIRNSTHQRYTKTEHNTYVK